MINLDKIDIHTFNFELSIALYPYVFVNADKLVKEEILGFWMRVAVVLLLTSVVIQLGFGGAILGMFDPGPITVVVYREGRGEEGRGRTS